MTTPDFSYSVFVEIKPTFEIREGEPAVARRVHTTCEQNRTPNDCHGQGSLPQMTTPPPESWKPQNLSSRERAQGVLQLRPDVSYCASTPSRPPLQGIKGRLPYQQPRPDAHFRAGPSSTNRAPSGRNSDLRMRGLGRFGAEDSGRRKGARPRRTRH